MGSSVPPSPPSDLFLARFKTRLAGRAVMDFAEFMDLALYDSTIGYYRRDRTRVGRSTDTDFFTATSSGPIFGELVAAACTTLLGPARAATHTFVELGAERGRCVLDGVRHPFAGVKTIGIDDPLTISGPVIVFSNELFDAQPCRRFVFSAGKWCERGVTLHDGHLAEILLETAAPLDLHLPATAAEGYALDLPLAARALASRIASEPWNGLFIAFDYGKSWPYLATECPQGTARAYRQHQQSNDLFAFPGEQDLTCHVCWDWIEDALRTAGLGAVTLESQEAFFVHHAGAFLARETAAAAAHFSPRKQALLQLLHPSHLGFKFQVLHALR
jgi:SAM-dependent MidA family methyltransferase